MMIVEPDKLPRAIVEHQGFGWIDVVVHGKPAHGSAPEEGVDAIVHMAEVVQRLHRLDAEVFAPNADPMNGRTVFHTGTIRGGTDYATYPGSAVLGIEIGTQPGEHLSDRVRDIESIFDDVRAIDPRFSGEVVVKLDREPFKAEGHEALYEAMDLASVDVLGQPLEPSGLNAWADSGLTQFGGGSHRDVRPAGRQLPRPRRVGVDPRGGVDGADRRGSGAPVPRLDRRQTDPSTPDVVFGRGRTRVRGESRSRRWASGRVLGGWRP